MTFNHPNILKLREIIEDEQHFFMFVDKPRMHTNQLEDIPLVVNNRNAHAPLHTQRGLKHTTNTHPHI